MSDESGLGDALRSKQETRAAEGAADAQEAAAGDVDWSEIGRRAEDLDEEEKPRREQMNVDLPAELKDRFKERAREEGVQMRFAVEDLVRLYLERTR